MKRLEADGRGVLLAGRGSRTTSAATLVAELPADRFNQLEIEMYADSQCRVKAFFGGTPGRPSYKSGSVSIDASPELQRCAIQIPRSARVDGPFASVRIVFQGAVRSVALSAIQLVEQPAEGLAPSPADGAQLLGIGSDQRRAVAITPKSPLEASFAARDDDARLLLSVGELADTYEAGRDVELRVTLTGDRGGEIALPYPIGSTDEAPSWRPIEIDLGGKQAVLKGDTWRASFELSANGAEDVACVIETPVVHTAQPELPSVLLITTDTHRGDYLGGRGRRPVRLHARARRARERRGLLRGLLRDEQRHQPVARCAADGARPDTDADLVEQPATLRRRGRRSRRSTASAGTPRGRRSA